MTDITEFKVSFSDKSIETLKQKLDHALYPDELGNTAWDLGAPLDDVQRLAHHWRHNFDFRKAEADLNELPQFQTRIQCDGFEPLAIHFVHIQSGTPDAIPLLFSHGWPGSFIEVQKIAKELTRSVNSGPASHIVAPSLPNFGFSQGTKQRGFAIEQYAETCHKLMMRLGYKKYATQGGDWGWYVTRTMSLLYPDSCLATHFNMDVGEPPESLVAVRPGVRFPLPDNPTPREVAGAKRSMWFEDDGFGYNVEQSTKPQTLAYALTDSPVACLSWIYEKLHDWTDNYPWTDDEICKWISIYWFSAAGPAAAGRIYYEIWHDKHGNRLPADSIGDGYEGAVAGKKKVTRKWLMKDHGTGVKIGQSHFPNDIHVLPSAWTRTIGDVVFETEHDSGGHFAAWERPQDIVQDLRDMFASSGEAAQLFKS